MLLITKDEAESAKASCVGGSRMRRRTGQERKNCGLKNIEEHQRLMVGK